MHVYSFHTEPACKSKYALVLHFCRLAIAFHLELLKMGRQVLQAMAVGEDCVAADLEKACVPDSEQPQDDRQVRLKRHIGKVGVHAAAACQKLVEYPVPKASIRGRPMADHTEKRPPIHSGIAKMACSAIPNCLAAAVLLLMATKWCDRPACSLLPFHKLLARQMRVG